ncbi:MAG: CBS domain-containing protein [Deltaproteobacteria bacterium]|nr:CBS domain-containing protein [Deltaproteobacteria bacterium]
MNVPRTLKKEKIQELKLRTPLTIESGTPLREVICKMQESRRGSVLVQKNGLLVGLFTERDAMTKGALSFDKLGSAPIDQFMSPQPKTIKLNHSIADAIAIMAKGGYRRLPIVDDKGAICGLVSARDMIAYLAEHFPYEVLNLPPDPRLIATEKEGA